MRFKNGGEDSAKRETHSEEETSEEDPKEDVEEQTDDTVNKKAEPVDDEKEEEAEQINDQDPKSILPQETTDQVEQVSDDIEMRSTNTATEHQQENKTNETGGQADSEGQDTQHGSEDAVSRQQSEMQRGRKRKDLQRSHEDRTLEQNQVNEAKKRKAVDADSSQNDTNDADEKRKDSEIYQHIQDENSKDHELTVDSATQEQLRRLDHSQTFSQEDEDMDDREEEDEEVNDASRMETKDSMEKSDLKPEDVHMNKQEETPVDKKEETQDEEMTMDLINDIRKDIKSKFFTAATFLIMPFANVQEQDVALEKLRRQLEDELVSLSVDKTKVSDERSAMELWMKYENLTSALAQQLCEQLRLVLEPTLASKMKGDYRTGKRLNMRKVIPYIASQFRKDKIWLRRTKKSKRQYQIMMAVDDSSSMADNHSKQLAFESLAVISNALRWLEAGDLAVCSFGEDARLIHSFDEPFSEHAGASILQQFTFEQKKTKIAQLLNMCTVLFNDYKSRGRQSRDTAISQLLLIVSDGRGIFLEGKEVVKRAAQQAREAGIFTVFLILDDPKNRDSILDIRVPIFKPGVALPEIKSYIEEFPFPFYVLLRDINSLPNVLSDALKQWFELVTQAT